MELPGQLATALGGRPRLETTMAAIRADLAAAPEEAAAQAIAA